MKNTSLQSDISGIPVIDIGPLRNNSNPLPVARALHHASREVGFIYIRNHGIPEKVIEETRAVGLAFFHHRESEKNTIAINSAHRGFLQCGGSKMRTDLAADLKESFLWGYEAPGGKNPDDHPLRGSNRWPTFMPGLQSLAMTYFDHSHRVAKHLMTGFALSLNLPPDAMLKTSAKPLSRASFVYYPPQDLASEEKRFGVGPHTDFGVLTVLCQDAVGGLEIKALDGSWIPAPPIPGTLVVNVGDLLSRWTNGAYRSTPHRVINTSNQERLSIVLAYDPEPQTMIDPRDLFGLHTELCEPPVSCGDYLTWRFEKAFSYRTQYGDTPPERSQSG